MSTALVESTMPMIGLVTWYSVDGPKGSVAVGAVLKSVDAANACAMAASIARTTCGTIVVPVIELGYAVAAGNERRRQRSGCRAGSFPLSTNVHRKLVQHVGIGRRGVSFDEQSGLVHRTVVRIADGWSRNVPAAVARPRVGRNRHGSLL